MSVYREKYHNIKHYRLALKGLCLSLVLVASSITSILVQTTPVSAVGSMYLTPANGSVAHDGNITLSFRINPTTPVTVVEGTVNFNPASLQFVSVNSAGSPFDATVQQTASGSTVKIARAKLDSAGVNTDALIANITFKALPYSGSSPVTISAANAAYDGAYTNPSVSGATVNFTPGSCPAGQVGTPPNCTTPASTGGSTTTTPPKTTTTPKPNTNTNTNNSTPSQSAQPSQTTPTPTSSTKSSLETPTITSQASQYTILDVAVSTNVAARAYLVYGTTQDALNVQSSPSQTGTAHALSINEGITPGSQLFYKVVATDGVTTKETEVKSIALKGMSVKIGMLDKNMMAVKNQEVTLLPSNTKAKSDGSGSVIFNGLAPGEYTVQIDRDGKAYQQHITVIANTVTNDGLQTSEQQLQAVVFDDYVVPAGLFPVWTWYVGGAILLLGLLAFFVYQSWRKNGIVRSWYVRARDYQINKKLEGVALGGLVPAAGLSATPSAAVGSKSPINTSAPIVTAQPTPVAPPTSPSALSSAETPYQTASTDTVNNNNYFGSNGGRNNG